MADIYYLPHEFQKKREELAMVEFQICLLKEKTERERVVFRKTKFIYATTFFSLGMIFSTLLFFLLGKV